MRQLVHSLSGHNNLVSFHLWGREVVLKSEKVPKCFVQDCLKNFLSVFTCQKKEKKKKKENLFINTALLQLDQRLAPNSYLTLKCKTVFFEKYHIQVFFCK